MFGYVTHTVARIIPLATLFAVDCCIQAAGCLHACLYQTEHYYDLIGTVTFIVLTGLSVYLGKWPNMHHFDLGKVLLLVPSIVTCLWAMRLGGYLFARVKMTGQDSRFATAKRSRLVMTAFWALQSIWVMTTVLPVLWINLHSGYIDSKKQDLRKDLMHDKRRLAMFVGGAALSVLGLVIETVADIQKAKFKADPKNRDKFISTGAWNIVRYPNYAGEIQVWLGQYLMCCAIMNSLYTSAVFSLSPLFTIGTLLFVSGIPVQEKQQQKRWGANPAFQRYHQRTPALVPGVY